MKLYDCANCGVNQVDREDDYCEECKEEIEQKEKHCSYCKKVIEGEPFREYKSLGTVYCSDVCMCFESEEAEEQN